MSGFDVFKSWREARNAEKNDCDVEFLVLDDMEGELKSVRAHKDVLKIVSPVWKQQFFGPLSKDNSRSETCGDSMNLNIEIIKIEDFYFKSFQDFMNIIYGNHEIDKKSDIKHLVEVLKLVDKYQVCGLKSTLLSEVYAFNVTPDNMFDVLKVVHIHQGYSIFEDLWENLGFRCADAVYDDLKTAQDVYKLHTKSEEDPELMNILFKHLSSIDRPNKMEQELKSCKDIHGTVRTENRRLQNDLKQSTKEYNSLMVEYNSLMELLKASAKRGNPQGTKKHQN